MPAENTKYGARRSGRLLRRVAVGVLEHVYYRGVGLQARGVLGAGRYIVGLAWFVRLSLAGDSEVERPCDDDTPLGAVGVGWDLELFLGAEEDGLAVGTRNHAPFQTLEGSIDLGEALDPIRVRVHRCSFPRGNG